MTFDQYAQHVRDLCLNPEERRDLILWLTRCKSAKDLEELDCFNNQVVWAVVDQELDFIVNTILEKNPKIARLAEIIGVEEYGEWKRKKDEEAAAEDAERRREEQRERLEGR
jgi:hypothetical protein